MSKLLGYKDIIRNMIWNYLYDFAHEKSEQWPTVDENIVLERDDDMFITFKAIIKADNCSFHVHGAVSEFGRIGVSTISYDVLRCTEKDELGFWISESAVKVHVLFYGSEVIDKFNFETDFDKKYHGESILVWAEKGEQTA